ncbi:protein TolA [Silanimonas sp.]|jgi:colicin import membrane protein|uniref:protein TolA n=1 Tax=Silanimonas sp. TaxID=1929290 RepID=UPI0022C2B948|nr:protein TolA [Silanimonas sp.]MCZ8115426.1 protein TolA [Silanimonas sp.]
MRERPEDTGIAVGLAVGLHLLVVVLMFVAWLWTPAPEVLSVAGPPIEVELVQAAPVRDRERPSAATPPPAAPEPVEEEAAPPPQPEPEPTPQDAVVEPQPTPQTPQAVPDTRDQDRASRDAVSPEPPAPREQEERRREEQVDLTERPPQTTPEERQRLSAQQLERLKRLAALRTQREQAANQTRMEEQRDQQRQDLAARQPPSPQPAASPSEATPTPMAGNNGVDTSLRAAYVLAIQNAVERNWRRPETIPAGQRCRIVIVQIPGGEVISADVDPTCPYDALGRDSLERAVFAASPLPYAGFEDVFERRLGLNFQPAD